MTHRAGRSSTSGIQALPDTMDGLQVELLIRLDTHKTQGGTAHGLGDFASTSLKSFFWLFR
jgi:hypothetical protein